MKKRNKCLTPKELAYLLLISSVYGCSPQHPDYKAAYDICQKDKDYCKEKEKLDQITSSSSSYGGGKTQSNNNGSSNLFNYYLMYHMFFSRSSNMNVNSYSNRFDNFNQKKVDENRSRYRGFGVYNPGYVSRLGQSIASGETSLSTKSGQVFKSAQFKGSSKSSITGKSITRGSGGSIGRSMGISS